MSYDRDRLANMGAISASALKRLPNGQRALIAGFVISRQMPGTAKGFFFLSIEDETGVSRAIIDPDLFDRHRALLSHGRFLQVEGWLLRSGLMVENSSPFRSSSCAECVPRNEIEPDSNVKTNDYSSVATRSNR
jgi:DNA polymerase III alpha subunit